MNSLNMPPKSHLKRKIKRNIITVFCQKRKTLIGLLSGFIFYFGVNSISAQQMPINCRADDFERNSSKLCVSLKITAGRVDFDQDKSVFTPSDGFLNKLKISREQAERIVRSDLKKLFGLIEKPYRFALTEEEKELDDRKEFSSQTAEVREWNGEWLSFMDVFDKWARGNNRTTFVEIFDPSTATEQSGIMYPVAISDRINASLLFDPGNYDPSEGIINFNVADPITDWANEEVQILLPNLTEPKKKLKRLERIGKVLGSLSGKPRCKECIENRLIEFYTRFGLSPNVQFDNRNSSPLIITIDESPRIVSISWKTLEKETKDIDKILYSVLTDQAFRKYLKNKKEILENKNFDYLKYTGAQGPLLRFSNFQIQQLLVNQLGYNLSFASGEGVSKIILVIQKNTDSPESTNEETENKTFGAAPATAGDEGVITAHEQEKNEQNEFTPDPKSVKEKNWELPKDKKRYAGGGFEYLPNQGIRFFALGQISRFSFLPNSLDTISGKIGAAGDKPFGAINYFGDYLFFNKIHKRMSLQITFESDLETERKLDETLTDERRISGAARFEFEFFRDRLGNLLRVFAEAKRTELIFETENNAEIKQKLTTLDLGAFYLFETTEKEYPLRLKIEPTVKFGLGLANREEKFRKFTIKGNIHKVLPERFEIDHSARFEFASIRTPVYELSSFGGGDVIRGFRRDEILGRKLWSLQNEVWIPLPVGNADSKGLEAMLRQKVKLSPFYDVGGVYDVNNSTPSIRSGAGVGLRLIYNPIILKLDYGYGFQSENRKGKFYFSITSNLPF